MTTKSFFIFITMTERIKFTLLFTLLWVSYSTSAQEYSFTEVGGKEESNCFVTDKPIDVSEEHTIFLTGLHYELYDGDSIHKLVFRGYNEGPELTRHLKVQLSILNNHTMTVFDGDYTFPHGGTSEEMIHLMEIPFSQPYCVKDLPLIELTVESSGEVRQKPLYFEAVKGPSGYAKVIPIFTVQSEVGYLSGTISNQDGLPIPGARITFENMGFHTGKDTIYTDENGFYTHRITRIGRLLSALIKAPGCASFWQRTFRRRETTTHDVVLTDAVHYKTGRQSTIMLPEPPNPSWGRFYRVDRRDNWEGLYEHQTFFEREFEPKANVPYVIFPECDFDIRVSDYDLSSLPEIVGDTLPADDRYSRESIRYGLFGAYSSTVYETGDKTRYIFFVGEETADFKPSETSIETIQTAAFRAFLLDFGIPEYVFVGEETGIDERTTEDARHDQLYDLYGRMIMGRPKHGLYLKRHKKKIITN